MHSSLHGVGSTGTRAFYPNYNPYSDGYRDHYGKFDLSLPIVLGRYSLLDHTYEDLIKPSNTDKLIRKLKIKLLCGS
jgi:hypothetical protein